jgi:Zn-dependent metalloprotease
MLRNLFYILVLSVICCADWFFPKTSVIMNNQDNAYLEYQVATFVENNFDGDFELFAHFKRLGRDYFHFQQVHEGIPLYGSGISLNIAPSGKLVSVRHHIAKTFDSPDIKFSQKQALDSYLKVRDYAVCDSFRKVYFVNSENHAVLSWQLYLTRSSHDLPIVTISSIDGSLLEEDNIVRFFSATGTGTINFLPKHYNDPLSQGSFANGRVNISSTFSSYTDVSGGFNIDVSSDTARHLTSVLSGRYCNVTIGDGAPGSYSGIFPLGSAFNFCWDTLSARLDELNLYYHTDFIHSWYKRLDPDMTGMDYPVPARARIPDMPDNAYWDGYGTNYGGGNFSMRNFALFANIIYHEYTHGVTGWIYRGVSFPYSGETGAMNEAFSDYCPATILDDPRIGYLVPVDGSMFRRLITD